MKSLKFQPQSAAFYFEICSLTHWGRVTYICVSELTIIGSDNGLSPGWRQAIIWTNAGIMLIWPLGTNFSEILIEILTFSFKKMRLKMSSAKCMVSICLGLNELMFNWGIIPGDGLMPNKDQVITHRENSPVTETTPDLTLLSWGGWPLEKFGLQMDEWTDGQMDGQSETSLPYSTPLVRGIMNNGANNHCNLKQGHFCTKNISKLLFLNGSHIFRRVNFRFPK